MVTGSLVPCGTGGQPDDSARSVWPMSIDKARIVEVVTTNLHVRDAVLLWADASCRLGEMRAACRKKGTDPKRSVAVNAQVDKVQAFQLAAFRHGEIAVMGTAAFETKGEAAERMRLIIWTECDALAHHAVADPTDFMAETRRVSSTTPRKEGA